MNMDDEIRRTGNQSAQTCGILKYRSDNRSAMTTVTQTRKMWLILYHTFTDKREISNSELFIFITYELTRYGKHIYCLKKYSVESTGYFSKIANRRIIT